MQSMLSIRWSSRLCVPILLGVMAGAALLCQATTSEAQALKVIRKVVLDPGHGGENEGTRGVGGELEKDEVLKMARSIKERLERDHPGLEVVLTRSADVDLALTTRAQLANAQDADLFISVHMNAAANKAATGVEVFYLATDKSSPLSERGEGSWGQASSYLPEPEEVDIEGPTYNVVGELLPTILSDLSLARSHRDSAELAAYLLSELVAASGRPSRGVRQANFGVLRGVRIPAVVVELGFLSHPSEGRWLTTKAARSRVSGAFSRALVRLDAIFETRNYRAEVGAGR